MKTSKKEQIGTIVAGDNVINCIECPEYVKISTNKATIEYSKELNDESMAFWESEFVSVWSQSGSGGLPESKKTRVARTVITPKLKQNNFKKTKLTK